MDEYATDATDATTHLELEVGEGEPKQSRPITRQMDTETDKSQVTILQPVSGNGAGRKAKGKAETRLGTKERPSSITALKLIARQGADEKAQLEEWKNELMTKLASEIAHLQQGHSEAIEAQNQEMERQRQFFAYEIEVLREELKEVKEGKAEKARQDTKGKRKSLEKSTTPTEEEETTPPESQGNKSTTPVPTSSGATRHTEKRNYASVAASKPAQASEQPWTQVSYKNRKTNSHQPAKLSVNVEHQGRRILFPRETSGQQMSEADLMLVLNEALQKAGEGRDTRFSRVRYAPSGAISALLTEKANAGLLIPRLSNVLIRAAKTVDAAVVGVEVLEHWQRLKVHGMSLERYLGEGKMELLKREVESSTGIELKTLPRWLINENRLREQQETGNKRGSAIVITVKGEAEAKQLCASGLRFGGVVRVVEKFWEAGPSSVCMTCCGIGHERMGSCGNRPAKCVICTGPHKVEEHRCGVVGCKKGDGKICVHVTVKCANCGGNHAANSSRCTSRHKAEVEARREKKAKKSSEKGKAKVGSVGGEEEREKESSPEPSPDMDLGVEEWAHSPPEERVEFDEYESRDHTADY